MSFVNRSASSSNAPYAYSKFGIANSQTLSNQHSNTHSSVMYTRDWRSALRTPPTYRIGNRTVRFNYHFALLFAGICVLLLFFFYVRTGSSSSSDIAWLKKYASSTSVHSSKERGQSKVYDVLSRLVDKEMLPYNATYPVTPPQVIRGGLFTYRIGMVADLDTNSRNVKEDGSVVWRSYFKKGYLSYGAAKQEILVKWDEGDPLALESSFSLKGRGMELSELVTYNGKLLSFDDRTGLIYEIVNDKALPWIILLDGNGRSSKGFKSEWATVKQQLLYVGSMGKEWTTGMGEFENENPMYVKLIAPNGLMRSLDWSFNFKLMRREAMQISWPGYMIHESGIWSDVHKKWFFLPRRCSKEKYNETRDEYMGCNVLISVDENFTSFETTILDASNAVKTHGFSSFKFIPNTSDSVIVAIKTEELNGKTSTFITAFDIKGNILLKEQRIDTDLKYEGFEFI